MVIVDDASSDNMTEITKYFKKMLKTEVTFVDKR